MTKETIMNASRKSSRPRNIEPQIQYGYSEFKLLAQELADDVCREINKRAPSLKSNTPYKCQGVLEELISILQSRV